MQQGSQLAKILLTDAAERSTLAACRSLTRAGHAVHVLAGRAPSLAGVSRGVRQHVFPVPPLEAPERFAAGVAAVAREIGADLLLPMTDAAATAVLRHAALLPAECVLPLPSWEAFRAASDKAGILPAASAAGFAIPRSHIVPVRDHGADAALREISAGIVKPHRSVAGAGRLQRLGVAHFETAEQGRSLLAALPEEAFPVVVQERVQGDGVGLFALRWGGELRAVFAHRRIREVPPSGGVSVCRESIAPPPALVAAGTRLLESLNWEGVAMIECKHDPRSDRFYVIEINPRFWGSLQLAVDAGVDFPALLVAHALGAAPPPVRDYRVGVRSRWGWGEVDYVYLRAKLRERGESLLGALGRAVWDVLPWRVGRDRGEIWRWRDPLPFAVETLRRLGILR